MSVWLVPLLSGKLHTQMTCVLFPRGPAFLNTRIQNFSFHGLKTREEPSYLTRRGPIFKLLTPGQLG